MIQLKIINITWIDEESMYICEKKEKSNIVFHRRTKHSDLPDISKLIRMKTYDVFGTIDNARV